MVAIASKWEEEPVGAGLSIMEGDDDVQADEYD